MDIQPIKDKITSLFHKYKYVCLVLLVGIFLMAFPKSNQKNNQSQTQEPSKQLEETTE